jgi:hypothetical protein
MLLMATSQLLQTLRSAHRITRFMLVWFALSLGAAIASPLINPQSTELICSGSGVMKVLVKNADGSNTEVVNRMLDCPMCATVAAPPPVAAPIVGPVQPLACTVESIPSARIATLASGPHRARGPPVFS